MSRLIARAIVGVSVGAVFALVPPSQSSVQPPVRQPRLIASGSTVTLSKSTVGVLSASSSRADEDPLIVDLQNEGDHLLLLAAKTTCGSCLSVSIHPRVLRPGEVATATIILDRARLRTGVGPAVIIEARTASDSVATTRVVLRVDH